MKSLRRILKDESAQSLVEYSLIISLVALAAVGAVILFGESVFDLYENMKIEILIAL